MEEIPEENNKENCLPVDKACISSIPVYGKENFASSDEEYAETEYDKIDESELLAKYYNINGAFLYFIQTFLC